LVRGQNVFGFFTTVVFAVAALVALSDFVSPRTPSARIQVNSLQVVKGRANYYAKTKEEYAHIRFSLSTDLSSLFTWNTKQVFVYVTATWPNDNATAVANGVGENEAVIWDEIVTSPSADHLKNLGPAQLKKLIKSAKGKSIDKNRGRITFKNQKPKYTITEPSGKIAEREGFKLHVHYNVQPWVGPLVWTQSRDFGNWKKMEGGESEVFKLPGLKKKDEKKDEKKATAS